MDGFELRNELLKNPEIQKVPFFFLSTSKSPAKLCLRRNVKLMVTTRKRVHLPSNKIYWMACSLPQKPYMGKQVDTAL
jgi:hypothetical protein